MEKNSCYVFIVHGIGMTMFTVKVMAYYIRESSTRILVYQWIVNFFMCSIRFPLTFDWFIADLRIGLFDPYK